jgi:hypothetical protein
VRGPLAELDVDQIEVGRGVAFTVRGPLAELDVGAGAPRSPNSRSLPRCSPANAAAAVEHC